jgi:RNA polymerase sigma-70 factor (ECF subfamily)
VRRKGFDEFYRSTKDGCFRAVLATVGDFAEADDLLAEAYTRAWERWSDVSTHAAPAAWVVRVALNLHRDRWRSRRWFGRLRPAAPVPPPELDLDCDLLVALRALPDRQRDVVVMRVLLDLANDDVAEVLGIAPATVSVHLHRALTTLRLTIPSPVDHTLAPQESMS